MNIVTRFLTVLIAAAALPACSPEYDHVELELYSSPPIPVWVSGTDIEIPAGLAVAVEVEPIARSRIEYVPDDEVELESEDRAILRVDATENSRRFVFVGVEPGETCVVVTVLGDREDCIPARVTATP